MGDSVNQHTQRKWSAFPSSRRDQSQPADFVTQGDRLESKVLVSFCSDLPQKPFPPQGWRDLAVADMGLEGTHGQYPYSWGGLDPFDELVCSQRTHEA